MQKRRSHKLFNEYKLAEKELDTLVEACLYAPSSMNLQLSRLLVVKDKAKLTELFQYSYGNKQVESCSALFVLCSVRDFSPSMIRDTNVIETEDSISVVGNVLQANGVNNPAGIKKFLEGRSPQDLQAWADSQCYLTLGVLIQEAIKMDLDTCPLEGFDANRYAEVLGLNELGLKPVVLCAVGLGNTNSIPGEKKRIPINKYRLVI